MLKLKFYLNLLVIFTFFIEGTSQSSFNPNNLAIVVAAASANNTTANVVEIDKTTLGQTAIQTIVIPGTGTNAIRVSGSATSTLYMANSNDGTLLTFTGHNNTTTSSNANTLNPRAVVSLNNSGNFTLATTYTGTSGNQTRSATTINNTDWFIADQGGLYTNNATTASPAGNFRSVRSFGGNVFIGQASSTVTSIQVSTISSFTGGTLTGLPGLTNSSTLQDFYLISSGSNGTTFDILYVLRATSNTAGTIEKYSLVSGNWTSNGSYTTNFAGFGLCAEKQGNGAYLFVTSGQGALINNSVIRLTDDNGFNQALNIATGNNVTLFSTSGSTIIKGIAFAPKAPTLIPVVLTASANNGTEAAGSVITLTATAASAVTGNQSVNVNVTGTGITSGDYTLSSTSITIPNGQTTGNVTFTVTDDMDVEGTETAIVTISTPSAGISIGSPSSQNISIEDNDVPPPPTVSLSVSTNSANEADATSITVTATSASAVNGNQTVNIALSGSGISASDYFIRPSTISILNGQTTGTTTIVIVDDAVQEVQESMVVSISSTSSGLSLGSPVSQTITITNNDCSFLRKLNGITSTIGAEIPAFHPASNRLYVVAATQTEIYTINSSGALTNLGVLPLGFTAPAGTVAEPNSVSISGNIAAVAYAIKNTSTNAQEPGVVAFYNANDGSFVNSVNVGYLPDMITFSPDGSKVLTADEGEPNSYGQGNSFDPEGSVSVIDITNGAASATVQIANFISFNSQEAALKAAGVRIFGPGATVAKDFEPEYIAISNDGNTAYVALQENNAFAVLDIATATFTEIKPLGLKDHSLTGNTMDASDQDGSIINMQNWPVRGMYMPDAIASYVVGGNTYYITANEGDSRAYTGYTEEVRVSSGAYVLDPVIFPNATTLKQNANIGRLQVTNATGDTDGDGDFDQIHVYGGRSFSIWNNAGSLVYDSGDDLETITSTRIPGIFNSDGTTGSFDGRSDNKGLEPEGVCIGMIGDKTYAFIGIERTGDVAVYDVTNPSAPLFVQYINVSEDLNVEGLIFVPAANSPTGQALLITAAEVSKTISVYEVGKVIVTNTANAGNGTLRAAITCVVEGGTITYDQPSTVTSILTTPLSINKNVTIAGLNGMSKPLISVDFTSLGLDPGITIEDGKNVNFKDVDFDAVNNTNIPKNEIIIIENNAILSIKGSTGINDN